MTDTQTTSHVPVRLDLDQHASDFSGAMVRPRRRLTRSTLASTGLRELVRIRASQINGCAYCIDMHTKDARGIGEIEQRIYALTAWRETPFFTDRERAALAFTESVTLCPETHVPAEDYSAVAEHFSPDEVGALLSLIVTINAWNALGVASRAWVPGSYQP